MTFHDHVLVCKWKSTTRHYVGCYTKAPDVPLRADRVAQENLRRHVEALKVGLLDRTCDFLIEHIEAFLLEAE